MSGKEEVAEVTHYVRNKDLIPEIKKFNESGQISEELGRMLLLIAKNLSNKANFINYTWKDDMIQEAVLTCCKYLKNFDAGLQAVESGDAQLVFLMNPTRVTEVREVANLGEKMPQKSTYFYPKLLSGMVINKVSGSF